MKKLLFLCLSLLLFRFAEATPNPTPTMANPEKNLRSVENVIESAKKAGFSVFEGQNYDLTLVAERTSDTYTNLFTDVLHIVYREKGVWKKEAIRWTTKPGLYGEGAVLNPKWVYANGESILGVACMVSNKQYRGLWKFMNPTAKFQSNPFYSPSLWQVGDCSVYRDGDRNLQITKTSRITTANNYGICGHYMGVDITPQIFWDDAVNNWSLGCNGSPLPADKAGNVLYNQRQDFLLLYDLLLSQRKNLGDCTISLAILDSDKFLV